MRRFALVALLAASTAIAQDGNLFSSVRPDIIVVVSEHPTTAEIVQVTALGKGYPPELLKAQLTQLGLNLGASVRGIKMERPNLGTKTPVSFLRAEFATDGLIDRSKGIVRLGPLVKAFAGAPEPYTVHGMKIAFEGERTTKKMLRDFPLAGVVEVQGRASVTPPGIEYQVKLISQEPALIEIPDEYAPPANQKPASIPSSSPSPIMLVGLFLLAGVALGALVYLALLKAGGNRRSA